MDLPFLKTFNTSGPCNPQEHYMLPPLPRLGEAMDLIEGRHYFIVHGPRLSGKTTCLKALASHVNSEGRRYALVCSLKALAGAVTRTEAVNLFVNEFDLALGGSAVPALERQAFRHRDDLELAGDSKIRMMLRKVSLDLESELVVFFDDADSLKGNVLINFLHQLRNGYNERDTSSGPIFPSSIALAGLRDLRDYAISDDPRVRLNAHFAGPFNIIKKSLAIHGFSENDIRSLYGQHTEASGQKFTDEAFDRVWHWSEGQPWLVNSLANEIIEAQSGKGYAGEITGSDFNLAAKTVIMRNETHLDPLIERLRSEPRVRRAVESVVVASPRNPIAVPRDDLGYCVDLGLLKKDGCGFDGCRPANPVYAEVIIRALATPFDEYIPESFSGMRTDGSRLDMNGLLSSFREFWLKNFEMMRKTYEQFFDQTFSALSEPSLAARNGLGLDPGTAVQAAQILVGKAEGSYSALLDEAVAHLVLQAFLQRVLNGGADFVTREYAVGNKRIDLLIRYKGKDYPLEVKMRESDTLTKSIEQIYGYVVRCDTSEGWLVILDRKPDKPLARGTLPLTTKSYKGVTLHILRCWGNLRGNDGR